MTPHLSHLESRRSASRRSRWIVPHRSLALPKRAQGSFRWLAAGVAAVLGLPAAAVASELSNVTADAYYGAIYYRRALENHPELRRLEGEQARVRRVARDLGWSPGALHSAIEKSHVLTDPQAQVPAALRSALARTRVSGRVEEILVGDEEPRHVVLYVRFRELRPQDVVKDAAAIAAVVARVVPFVSTLSLATDTRWSGKISRQRMVRIQESRIEAYADGLYRGLFEVSK